MSHHHSNVMRMHFGIHDKIVIDGVEYTSFSSDPDRHVLRRVATPDLCEEFSHEQLSGLWDRRAIKRCPDFFAPVKVDGRGPDKAGLSGLSHAEREKIFWKQDWCDRFRQMEAREECGRSESSAKEAIERIAPFITAADLGRRSAKGRCGSKVAMRLPPAPSTALRWLRKYEAANLDPIVLRDRWGRSGNRTERFDPEVRAVLARVAAGYGDGKRPTYKMLHDVLRSEIDALNAKRADRGEEYVGVPGKTALRNEVKKLNAFQVAASRNGLAAARDKFDPVRLGVAVTRPLERVEMDEWNVQLHTVLMRSDLWAKLTPQQKAKVKRSRVWVSLMIDSATRCVLAVHLIKKSPTAEDALATMRMALLDKRDIAAAADCLSDWPMTGLWDTVVMDTGPAYIAEDTRAAICDLRAEAMFPPAGLPQMRGRIERVFSTIHTQFVSTFHGRTFKDVVDKGDYDAEAHAVVDPEELYRLLVRYVVDVYHHTPHEGLIGETPYACWKRLVRRYGVSLVDDDTVGPIFGTKVERALRREGVEVFGIMYAHEDLHVLHKRRGALDVVVSVDQTDIGRVFVLVDDAWMTVPAKRRDLDGVSLDGWLNRRNADRERFAAEAKAAEPIADQARAEFRAFADGAEKRAALKPLVYGSDKIRALAAVGSKFASSAASETDEDMFDEVYGIDDDVLAETDGGVSKEVETKSRAEKAVDADDFFMED
ncbi:Mu transposase C-terminal domain-containing protein [Mesorhizobium sp. YIM 152430]|uniref:Mu transposase C-terminal domain-containing protein n=1 Tax=Mesorhizobium sp. YIM 152430 TaxID=3031761 RepID=UPI0023DC903D|nr:Mu transposase C-terminal domain-containing protein [Mesorhizobium sp. YIM 152430]MDF1600870.1 Mu transposase C-terminal domain-containing protein [Mesorhizobium sp. YIM 152430]